jgi:hypothetical protein
VAVAVTVMTDGERILGHKFLIVPSLVISRLPIVNILGH